MTLEEWNYVQGKALELFDYGQYVADKRGLILVDTKYEFGKDINDNILLIDELHTCDSSRYWIKDTYVERFNNKLEPEKLDKDMIREYVSSKCDPYKDPIPKIPDYLIESVSKVYLNFYNMLTCGNLVYNSMSRDDIVSYYFNNIHNKMAVIISGSEGDKEWIRIIKKELKIG